MISKSSPKSTSGSPRPATITESRTGMSCGRLRAHSLLALTHMLPSLNCALTTAYSAAAASNCAGSLPERHVFDGRQRLEELRPRLP